MSRRWSALLVGETAGLIAELGDKFNSSPDHYERIIVEDVSKKFRVADVDNFDGEGPGSTERFVTGFLDWEDAQLVADLMNEKRGGPNAPRFFQVVPADYKLFIFEQSR